MGFWSGLAKVGGAITKGLGYAGVPGMSAVSDILGGAGDVLGSAAKGGADSQALAAQLAMRQGQLDLDRWNALNNQRLSSAEMGLKAPGAYGRQSMMADLLANPKAGSVTVDPATHLRTFGGFSPADFSQNTRDVGGIMSSGALKGAQAGNPFIPTAMPAAPTMPGASFWQKVGNAAAVPMSLAGVLARGGTTTPEAAPPDFTAGPTAWKGPEMPSGYDPFAPEDPYNSAPPSIFTPRK